MKVIHLMSTNDFSGAESVGINIVNSLDSDGLTMYYATQKGNIDNFLKEKNVKNIIHIDKLSVKEIRRIEKEYEPDIIHSHDYKASVLAAIACKKSKIISHLHNNASWIKNIFHPYVWLFLLISIKFSNILLVSDSIKKEYVFSKLINKKIKIVGNPVNREEILKLVNEDDYKKLYDICCVARLTEAKNPILFIDIISKLRIKNPNIKAIWVGKGELKEDCVKKIKKLNLENNIELVGFKKNPYKYMAASKIFLLTSNWEGYGLVAFEALTLGLPCVVSKVGGLADVVDNECGKLCKKEEEYIKEISELMTNRKKYTEASRKAIEKSIYLDNSREYYKNINDIYLSTQLSN